MLVGTPERKPAAGLAKRGVKALSATADRFHPAAGSFKDTWLCSCGGPSRPFPVPLRGCGSKGLLLRWPRQPCEPCLRHRQPSSPQTPRPTGDCVPRRQPDKPIAWVASVLLQSARPVRGRRGDGGVRRIGVAIGRQPPPEGGHSVPQSLRCWARTRDTSVLPSGLHQCLHTMVVVLSDNRPTPLFVCVGVCRRLTVGSAAPPQSGFVHSARFAATAAGSFACLLMTDLGLGQPGTQCRSSGRTRCSRRGPLTGSCSRSSRNCRRGSRDTSLNSVLGDP